MTDEEYNEWYKEYLKTEKEMEKSRPSFIEDLENLVQHGWTVSFRASKGWVPGEYYYHCTIENENRRLTTYQGPVCKTIQGAFEQARLMGY